MKNDRRDFLKQVGSLTAAAVATPALAMRSPEEQPDTAAVVSPRAFASHKFALELDGAFAGWLQSVEGGAVSADVVTDKLDGSRLTRKHLAGLKYEDITINCGTGMSKAFYEWIAASFDVLKAGARRDGAIVTTDFQMRERARLDFYNALVSEFGLPALDASSRDAARMSLKFTPEFTQNKLGSLGTYKFSNPIADKWLTSDFRLTISGLEGAAAQVQKIDALTIKQQVVVSSVGQSRDAGNQAGGLDFPNLAVSLPLSRAQSFYDWEQSFMIQGNNGDGQEKSATLEYLDRRGATLFSLSFRQVGLFRLGQNKGDVAVEQPQSARAEMYVDRIDFKFNVGWY